MLLLILIGGIGGTIAGIWAYNYITRDLPNLTKIEDYKPLAVSSVYSRGGELIAEFFEERRYPASLSEIPLQIRQAF